MRRMRRTSSTFSTSDGLTLFERHWQPEGPTRADVVIVHGYAEHSGRYEHVGEALADRGYAVHAFDLRGHGQSEGRRVFVRSVDEYLGDLDTFLARCRDGDRPLFLLGHSMGGTIVTLEAATRSPLLDGLILSGPALTASGTSPVVAWIVQVLGRFLPRLRTRKLDAAAVSRDPAVVAAYDADPLVDRGKMYAGLAAAMMRAMRTIDRDVARIRLPLLVMHGTEDQLADPQGSRSLHERVSSPDKTLHLYAGLYHEIFNEPEQQEVLADVVAWLDARTGG
jgi:acylglycerol lipase